MSHREIAIRPGGNLTGVSFFTNQMEAKRLGLLHELVPKIDLVAVLTATILFSTISRGT